MTPLYISGCFGWLHMPDRVPVSGRGVILCATIGNEAMNVHRAWVMLAEKFAALGLPALRFDYPGTGDSTMDEDAVSLGDWTSSIVEAASWLRTRTGITEVSLCGLRAGAALATLAASRIDGLGPLALLAPVVSGRAYLRELMITARAWDAIWMVDQPIEHDGWFEAAGLRCPVALKRELETIDLRKVVTGPATPVLIMDPGTGAAVQAFADRLSLVGATVEHRAFPGSALLMRDALESVIPHAAFDTVAVWLATKAPAGPGTLAAPPDNITIDLDRTTETPVRFGTAHHLFGIYCAPDRGPLSDCALLILNTGGHSHVGHSRYAVTFARRLAGLGIPSLRMDASGIGDSDSGSGDSGRFYDPTATCDARAGLDWLAQTTGRRVSVLGLCSGAYTALQLGVADPRVAGLVLGNLQRFVWSPGTSLRVVQRSTRRTTEFYLRNIRTSAVWWRMLRAEIDVAGICRTLAGRALRRIRSAADPILPRLGRESRFSLVRSWFRALDQRRVPVLLALSFNDPGLDELEEYFGAHGQRLNAFPHVRIARLENADHTLSHQASRAAFLALLIEWLGVCFRTTPHVQLNSPILAAD